MALLTDSVKHMQMTYVRHEPKRGSDQCSGDVNSGSLLLKDQHTREIPGDYMKEREDRLVYEREYSDR